MGGGERGDNLHELQRPANKKHQTHDKQDVIESEEEMLDAELQIGRDRHSHRRIARQRHPRRLRPEQMIDRRSVEESNAEQDISQRPRQPRDLDFHTRLRRVGVATVDRPSLNQRRVGQVGKRPRAFGAAVREAGFQRQAANDAGLAPRQYRLLPEHVETARGYFGELEVGRPDFVGFSGERKRHRAKTRDRPASRNRPEPLAGRHPSTALRGGDFRCRQANLVAISDGLEGSQIVFPAPKLDQIVGHPTAHLIKVWRSRLRSTHHEHQMRAVRGADSAMAKPPPNTSAIS